MTMADLRLNDPVYVGRGEGQQLEGIVAFLGRVEFAAGDDWVGVRLTGSSVGQGKNDGSVKGVSYFSTSAPNGGVFVKRHNLSARSLTRLEELRLKRELKASAAKSSSTPARMSKLPSAISTPSRGTLSGSGRSNTSGSNSSSASLTPATTPRIANTSTTASAKSATISSTAAASKSRLDEIRERRAALQRQQSNGSQMSSGGSSRNHSRSNSPERGAEEVARLEKELGMSNDKLQSLQKELSDQSHKLQASEVQTSSLLGSLSEMKEQLEEAQQMIKSLQSDVEATNEKAKSTDGRRTIQVTSEHVQGELEEGRTEILQLQHDNSELKDNYQKVQQELSVIKKELDMERESKSNDSLELTRTKSELAALQHQLTAIQDQATVRSSSDASHYKERAKLQAELGAAKRQVGILDDEKVDLEAQLEDLILDKEQLVEEKEILQDKVEELKIDAETAQMEVEELRLELEDAKGSMGESQAALDVASSNNDDVAQALSTQNARLREALIRLREQTSFEKVEHTRQLRAAEKAAAEGKQLVEEVTSLRVGVKTKDSEIQELKEMVEQGSALESMVEDLSDRVMALEDDNVALQSTIRELEEAGDIAAELEEVQAEEVKALMRDLEARDSIVRNLEEAIKMQRRREEDFQRTVGNYRKSVDTLKQEKNELLALQRGSEGEKSDLFASSQKALSRAAQLVANAANARKKEARAAFHAIECEVQRHMSDRLESMFPQGVVSTELAAIKGELLLCNVIGKSSKTLNEMSSVFEQTIRSGINEALAAKDEEVVADAVLQLSEEAVQGVENMLHQTKFSISAVEMSANLIRLLSAGQWPDVLSTESSADIGAMVGHSLGDLDMQIGTTLKTLLEEGALSPHQCNLGAFQQSVLAADQAIKNSLDVGGKPLISDDWTPPAWSIMKNASLAKFSCLGAGAAIAAVINPDDSSGGIAKSGLKTIMTKLEQIGTEATKISARVSQLDITNEKLVRELDGVMKEWNDASTILFQSVSRFLHHQGAVQFANVTSCREAAEATLRALTKLSSSLRAADLNAEEGFHPFSTECQDSWTAITTVAQEVRVIDGDRDDVNYLIRARAIEARLADAIESEPKLISANTKITSLEKTLDSRSKEIAMQNVRLSELEKLLAKSNIASSPPNRSSQSKAISSSEELVALKEENRVLTEAMDVLQQQVDEYELEIKLLKDPKSPRARMTGRSRSNSPLFGGSIRRFSRGGDEIQSSHSDSTPGNIAALQAALFRPALESARREVSALRARAIAENMLGLPPLNIDGILPLNQETKEEEPIDELATLADAKAKARREKSSVKLVDLSLPQPASIQLMESLARTTAVDEDIRRATEAAMTKYSQCVPFGGDPIPQSLLGKITITASNGEVSRKIPLKVSRDDISKLHLHMIQ